MNDELRNKVWDRNRGICQKCGRKLYKLVDPYEQVIEELLALKRIKVFKWFEECWKCHKETPVVSYHITVGYDYHIGDIEKLDKLMMRKYAFVKLMFSKTMGKEVIANTCVNCGALQGNWFIMEDLIEMESEGMNTDELVDITLPNNLEFEDLPMEKEELKPYEERLPIAHIHHKDGNRENNDLDNLMLLCRDCHVKTHSEIRNPSSIYFDICDTCGVAY